MTFEDVWRDVKGLSDTTMLQVPGVLSESTKKKLSRMKPEEVGKVVAEAIEEVNRGSVIPLDTLIQRRL
jgi:hypothetical protein